MLGSDLRFGMLMAAVTGVLSLIAHPMAGGACGFVILVGHEKARVIEGGRFPAILTVALRALGCWCAMDRRFGGGVA